MQPTARDLHVDALLTELSIGYTNPEYIADRIFPLVRVNKQSDIVPKYDQSHWFRNLAAPRAPGGRSARSGWTVNNSDTYFAMRYSIGHEIPDEVRDNADAPYNVDRDAVAFVTDKILMNREVSFASDFFKTGVWGADKTGGVDFTKWSDYASSSPLVDFTTFRDLVELKIGREPNTLVLGKPAWNKLKWHPDLIDLIKHTQRGQLSVDLFATLTEFSRVLIGKAIYTTSAEGTAEGSVTYTRIWDDDALMLWVPEAASLLTPAAGYTFVWQRVPNMIQYIKRMRDEEREVDIIEANTYYDQKVTAARAGLFMADAVD
jgi:hypothetical protein